MRYTPTTAQRIKEIDEIAISKYRIPSLILMENAGRGIADKVFECIRSKVYSRIKPIVVIFCGKGNNGGDGMVCARYLFNRGVDVRTYIIGGNSSLKGDPAIHHRILQKMGIPINSLSCKRDLKKAFARKRPAVIVDAIFGVGFKGESKGIYKTVIEYINSAGTYTVSVDVPSGLNATTGMAIGPCINADETVTMALPKIGFYKNDGPRHTGKITVIDIGWPRQLTKDKQGKWRDI